MSLYLKTSITTVSLLLLIFSTVMGNPIAPHWGLVDSTAPARYDFGAAYDALHSSIVVFGGIDSSGNLPADTWKWDAGGWQQVATSGPDGRSGFGMCYMDEPGVIFLFGGWSDINGYLGDTWIWNGTSWNQISVVGPPARSDFAMAYDQSAQSVILFGGTNGDMVFGDTWEWDGTQWSLVDITGPVARIYSKMVDIPNNDACILFGGLAGYGGETLDDSWAWIGNDWVQLSGENPSPRMGYMMAYDPTWSTSWSVELFGGQDGPTPNQYFDDTWELDDWGWYWVEMGEPSARSFGQMVYHPGMEQVIIIGGTDGLKVFHDMWAYPVFEGSCSYTPGDVNGRGGFTGLDVVYAVAYLKGGAAPPLSCECPVGSGRVWYVAGDVNASCNFTGLDVSYMVAYLKGGPGLRPCEDCPPARIMVKPSRGEKQ